MDMCYTDISDETWQRLEPVLPLEGSPKGGRPAKDKRTFINHKCNHLVAAYWGSLVYLRGKLLEALGHLLDLVARSEAGRTVRLTPNEAEAIDRAKAILRGNLACPPTIQVLAGEVGLNRNKLQAGFRQSGGESVAEYLRALRMERAMDILETEDVPIREVAERVGYRSPINFYRAFERAFSLSPGAMRRMLRAGGRYDSESKE